jgi:hypothetical protein
MDYSHDRALSLVRPFYSSAQWTLDLISELSNNDNVRSRAFSILDIDD